MSLALFEVRQQPCTLPTLEKGRLYITTVPSPSGEIVGLSRYEEPLWNYAPLIPHAARERTEKEIDFRKAPSEWWTSLKDVVAVFTTRKPPGGVRYAPQTVCKRAPTLFAFAKWCSSKGIHSFNQVRPFDMAQYISHLRSRKIYDRTLANHLSTLKRVYEMRADLVDAFNESVHKELRVGPLWEPHATEERRTAAIPLRAAEQLFQAARDVLQKAEGALALRDRLEDSWCEAESRISRKHWGNTVKMNAVREAGYKDVYEFESLLVDIRTATYIVLGITTGCRVHELGDIRSGCLYSEVIDGETFLWLSSHTRKEGDRPDRWMAPEIATVAVRILERCSEPIRARVRSALRDAERMYCSCSEAEAPELAAKIVNLRQNVDRLYLTEDVNGVVSIANKSHNKQLRAFEKRHGIQLETALATHQLRRTFAVAVVHLNKGVHVDLHTLQWQLKHASMVTTEGYAKLPGTDHELLELIEEESDYFDLTLVNHWLDGSTSLSGGLGRRIKAYPGRDHQPIYFATRKEFVDSIRDGLSIRSTGHSWCTNEGRDCGGHGLYEYEVCGQCNSGVIDETFTDVWIALREQNTELTSAEDIGPGGRARAAKLVEASNKVLADLALVEVGE